MSDGDFTERRKECAETRLARLEERLVASDRALELAKGEVDRRLNTMNEMREQINQERGSYVVRIEYEEKHKALLDKIDQRSEVVDNKLNDLKNFQYLIIGGVTVMQVVIGLLLHYWHG